MPLVQNKLQAITTQHIHHTHAHDRLRNEAPRFNTGCSELGPDQHRFLARCHTATPSRADIEQLRRRMTGSSNTGDPGTPEVVTTCSDRNEANAYAGTSDDPTTTHREAEKPGTVPAMVEHQAKVTAEVAGIDSAAEAVAAPEPPHISREQEVVIAPELQVQANAEDSAENNGPTSPTAAAAATSATRTDPPLPPPDAATAETELSLLEVDFVQLTQDSYFVHPAMRSDVSDAFFVAVAQMRPCGLTKDDRVGKYRQREEGFVGMCCQHCGGQPGTLRRACVSLVLCQCRAMYCRGNFGWSGRPSGYCL